MSSLPATRSAAATVVLFLCVVATDAAATSSAGSSSSSSSSSVLRLPNTAKVDGQLTANLGVDHFFSLWIVFNNDDVVISDEPFTILAPKNKALAKDNHKRDHLQLQQPDVVKRLLSDHIVLGARVDLNASRMQTYTTLGGRNVTLAAKEDGWLVNGVRVLDTRDIQPNGVLLVVDDYLFHAPTDRKDNHDDDDERPHASNLTGGKSNQAMTVAKEDRAAPLPANAVVRNVTFIENVMQVLSLLKSGVRVFQHFLSRSNVSKLLNDDDEYTVFVPTDHAFQRWHPIDWGFYPFSVPEFTESVIINHFVKGKLKQDALKTDQTAKTIGGKEVVFRKTPNLTANGAAVVKGDTPLPKGNIMFISEVLFVSESVVSRLHAQHRDKETPPLLAFPWFGAQFLSHAFLALERDRRFAHITRFLNLADLAPHVSGTGYTFFVPTDTAFEEIGLDKMPDNYLSNGDGLDILLNHFVKGRLYDRDLKDQLKLMTLGNRIIDIGRRKENVTVNKAHIVESEVFVYNLGTMFYIDKVLFAKPELLPKIRRTTTTTTSTSTSTSTTTSTTTTIEPSTATTPQTTATQTPEVVDIHTSTPSVSYDNVNDGSTMTTTTASAGVHSTTPFIESGAGTSPSPPPPPPPTTTPTTTMTTIVASETTADVERVPEELSESGGSLPDVLFADAEIDNNKASTTTTAAAAGEVAKDSGEKEEETPPPPPPPTTWIRVTATRDVARTRTSRHDLNETTPTSTTTTPASTTSTTPTPGVAV